MPTTDDIEAHREAALRRWADSPRHSWIGMHARSRTELSGEVLLTMRRMTRLVRDLARMGGEPPGATRHPFAGANRKAKRATAAKARRRA